MIKKLVVVAAFTLGLAGYAVAQQARLRCRRIICRPIISCAVCRPIIRSATFRLTIRCAIIQRALFRHKRRSNGLVCLEGGAATDSVSLVAAGPGTSRLRLVGTARAAMRLILADNGRKSKRPNTLTGSP